MSLHEGAHKLDLMVIMEIRRHGTRQLPLPVVRPPKKEDKMNP